MQPFQTSFVTKKISSPARSASPIAFPVCSCLQQARVLAGLLLSLCGTRKPTPHAAPKVRKRSTGEHMRTRKLGNRPYGIFRVYQRGCTSLHAIRATFLHPSCNIHSSILHIPKISRLTNPPSHQRPTISLAGRAAFHSSHRNKSSNQAVPADHLRAQPWRGISIARRARRVQRARRAQRATLLTTGEAHEPETAANGHS